MEEPCTTNNQKEISPVLNPAAYTLEEAAIKLRRSGKTIRRLIDRGLLRRDKTFYKVMIPRKDVDSFFERNSAYSFAA